MAKRNGSHKKEKELHPDVILANSISIIDFARKEGMNISYEDGYIARISDISGYGEIIVDKDSNSWEYTDQENKTTHGNTIRFAARMNEMEWNEAVDFLIEERASYLSNSEYNQSYLSRHPQRNHESKVKNVQADTSKNKDVSIVEYAKSIGLEVKEVNDRLALIPEYPSLLIHKKNNTWNNSEQGVKDGNLIQFVSKFQNVSEKEAVRLLDEYQNSNESVEQEVVLNQKNEQEVNLEKESETSTVDSSIENKEVSRDESKEFETDVREKESKRHTKAQLAEIIAGMRHGVDITQYDDPRLKANQMREIRYALEKGNSLKDFISPTVSAEYIKEVRLAMEDDTDLSLLQLNEKKDNIFSAEQVKEIRMGLKNGLLLDQVKVYAKNHLDAATMKELRLGLQDGFDKMKDLANGHFKAEDIHTIRIHLIVKKIMQTIQFQLRQFYENIIDVFKKQVIIKEPMEVPQGQDISRFARMNTASKEEELVNEAAFELNEVAQTLYESMEEDFYQKDYTFEQKKDAMKRAINEVVQKANEIEHVSGVELDVAVDEAVEFIVNEKEEKTLQNEAMKSMKAEFVEKFYEYENDHYTKLAEFAQDVIAEKSISYEHKVEILYQTLGEMYDEKVAKNWIEHLYQPESEIVEEVKVDHQEQEMKNSSTERFRQMYEAMEQETEIIEEYEFDLEQ
ncbi:hypothetical protein [Anaeromicropila herbilytica]|uniref:Uncharacterized protein n=1 Tax=Anaeromicropila herbilytica TaxID=2785025 RepID=A0A7R7IC58_9FIRM|nr:hypothetical protein [Anaeromicropila herbilytica]BCN29511.1 hypothetical protein bsdtb5_08060 [Anaeromicropila herbilytica]